MFDKNAIKESFSRIAVDYDKNAFLQETVRKQTFTVASDYFIEKSTILDLGCGTGALLQDNNKEWNIVGVDIAYGMCKIASARNMLVINATAEDLPLRSESFSYIFSSLVMQWAENPKTIIKEILRVLKPEGIAVVSTFVQGTLSELEEAFANIDNKPHISKFIDAAELLMCVAHAGGIMLQTDGSSHILYYDDVLSLMHSIKNVGASNKLSNRRKGLMTPSQLRKIEQNYKSENNKISASWQVLTMVIGKM